MSDTVLIAIVTAFSSTVAAIVTGYFGYKIHQSTKSIKKTTETTLQHVNHAVIAQQKAYVIAARLNAELSQNLGYKKIADDAEAALAELIKAQAAIDRGEIK